MTTKVYLIDPLWRWGSALEPSARKLLLEAVHRNHQYAAFVAWVKLHDHAMADVLIDAALDAVIPFVLRCTSLPMQSKVSARLRSQIRRVAKQKAHQVRLEEPKGLLYELAVLARGRAGDLSDTFLISEICSELSPRARDVAEGIRQGYSWREIARSLNLSESSVRQSFRREVDAALLKRNKGVRAPTIGENKSMLQTRGFKGKLRQ